MTIREWIEMAPLEIREELQSVPVLNFLRQHRNNCFQLIGSHDGSISESCKQLFQRGYESMHELIESLEGTQRPPNPYNPYDNDN